MLLFRDYNGPSFAVHSSGFFCSAALVEVVRKISLEPRNRLLIYSGPRPLFERALAISEKVLGLEHPETADCFNNVASLLLDQGDLAGARPLFERTR
jgi:hypothetical protein